MSKAQRIILALYCLLVDYCCIWIPWDVHMSATIERWYAGDFKRIGYGWLWSGPNGLSLLDTSFASPSLALIGLRLLASTALAACALLTAGIISGAKPASLNLSKMH